MRQQLVRHGGMITRPASVDLAQQIAALEHELVRLKQQQRDADDARFLRAIAIAVHGCVFNVRDLVELAALDADLCDVLGGRRPKQIGKQLARCADREIHGLRVQRVKVADDGAWVWEIHFREVVGDRG